MNIKDIAKQAGVSIATVSRVINGKSTVNKEIKEKVLKIIVDNDYRPNLIARGLVSKKSNLIGIILPQVNGYYTGRIEGAFSEAEKEGYGVIIASRTCRLRGEVDNFYTLVEKQVEGILYFATKITEEHKEAFAKVFPKTPIVMVDQEIEGMEMPCVVQDNYSAAVTMMEHLIGRGHKKIAYIAGSDFDKAAMKRYDAYVDTLNKYDIEIDNKLICNGTFSIQSGYREMDRMFEDGQKPTAVFAANDNMAIGAMKYLLSRGYAIPKDVAVAGFDDIEIASYMTPALTTIRQDYVGTGSVAAKMLIELIRKKETASPKIVMKQELIVREST